MHQLTYKTFVWLALLQYSPYFWSGTEPTIFSRYACMYGCTYFFRKKIKQSRQEGEVPLGVGRDGQIAVVNKGVGQSPQGAITKRGAYNSIRLLPPSSGGKKPKVQVSAGLLLPLKFLGKCPSWPLTIPGGSRHSLACGHIPPASASIFLAFFPCVSLCASILFPLLTQTPVTGFKTRPKSGMI